MTVIKPPATWPQHLASVVVMTPMAGAGALKCVKVAFLGQDCSWAQTTPGFLPPLQHFEGPGPELGGIPGFQQAHSRHYSTLYGWGMLPCSPTHPISAAKSHPGFLELLRGMVGHGSSILLPTPGGAVKPGCQQTSLYPSCPLTYLCVCFPPAGPVPQMSLQAPSPHLGPC